jgi:hypothetical protein
MPTGMEASVGVSINVNAGQDLRCYFPGFYTTSSTYHNIDIFLEEHNYHHTDIPRAYWSKYSQYNQINVGMNTHSIPYGLYSFDDYYDYVGENNYWAGVETGNSRYYDLNFSYSYALSYPEVYMAMYAPVPTQDFCNNWSWSVCRFYDQFINRRYFFVAKSTSSSIASFRIQGNSAFPPSRDSATGFYDTLLYMTDVGNSRYYYQYSNARTSSPNLPSVMSPSTNTKDIKPSMFGSFL